MSILLESLNQSKPSTGNSQDGSVPSVDDSHFDDEMLSDEWLLKKLLVWKIISAILLAALLVSWTGFYLYSSTSVSKVDHPVLQAEQNATILDSQELVSTVDENKEISKTGAEVSKVLAEQRSNDEDAGAANKSEILSSQTKEKYQPKKIEKSSIGPTAEQNKVIVSVEKKLTGDPAQQENMNKSEQVIEFDSLSEMEKQELPELEITSYAVSSNPEKSFVVLNGAFYGQGETISPFLVLISINKEGILLRYKGRMISKKYSL